MASSSDSSLFSSSDSSLFSSSEDEFDDILNIRRRRPKNKNYIEETVSLYNETEFMEHFRISRELTENLSGSFSTSNNYSNVSGGNGKISAIHQVMIFLWFTGHQTASFRDVADRFDITISTLFRIIRRVMHFLSESARYTITWPSLEERQIIEGSFRENGFPGVCGVIDGTHIRIDKPKNDPESYFNRKQFYSIQMQVVCDNNLKIRDVFIGFPGSVHDSRVYRSSTLSNELEDKCQDMYILGDSGYPCLRNLLTPFRDRGNLTEVQQNYNIKHSKTRYRIEHCFGRLKQKFRQLYHLKLKKIEDICHFVRACCVLHNMSLDDVEFNPEFININEYVENRPHNINGDELFDRDDRDGVQRRNFVAQNI